MLAAFFFILGTEETFQKMGMVGDTKAFNKMNTGGSTCNAVRFQ